MIRLQSLVLTLVGLFALTAHADPGKLDAQLLGVAAKAKGVTKIQLYAAPDGTLRKVAVYHADPAQVPEPVRALAKSKFGEAAITSYESELYADLGQVYEITAKTESGEQEIAAKADGTLVYMEHPVALAAVPAAVKATAEKAVPGGEWVEAEEKKGPAIHQFGVKLTADGVTHYLRISPAGELLNHGLRLPAMVEVGIK